MGGQENGHVPEFAVAALEAAISGLGCGASDEEVEQAFVTVYNALARLGQRDAAIGPTASPSRSRSSRSVAAGGDPPATPRRLRSHRSYASRVRAVVPPGSLAVRV